MIDLNKNIDNDNNAQLVISDEMKSDLLSIARWVNFMNIVGIIGLVILVLAGIVSLAFSYFVGVIYILLAGIFCFPLYRSFQFVRQAREAVEFDDNDSLGYMFGSMRYIVRFYGIYSIVVLGTYAVILFLGIASVLIR